MKASQVAAVKKKLEDHIAKPVQDGQSEAGPIHQAAGGPGWVLVVGVTG